MLRRQEGASGPAIAEAVGQGTKRRARGLSKKGVTVEALERVRPSRSEQAGREGQLHRLPHHRRPTSLRRTAG
jgi:hypothetical protein